MLSALILSSILVQVSPPKLCWSVSPGIGSPTSDSLPIPRRTLLRRGQIVKLVGSVQDTSDPPQNTSGAVFIRVGIDTRQQIAAVGPWTAEWNTANERAATTKLTIIYRIGNQPETTIKTCDITFLDADPLTASATPQPDGTAKLTIALAPGLAMERPKIVIDGHECESSLDGGSATLSRADLASPFKEASLQVYGAATQNGSSLGVLTAPPLRVPGIQDLSIDSKTVRLSQASDPFDTMIEVSLASNVPLRPGSARVVLGTRVVPAELKDGMLQLDPRSVDSNADVPLWVTVQDSKGHSVYSEASTADALHLRETKATLERQLETERERLRRVFKLDLGYYRPRDKKGKPGPSQSLIARAISLEAGLGLEPLSTLDGPQPRSISLATVQVVHFYAPPTPDGQALIASRFRDDWKTELVGNVIKEDFESHISGPKWTEMVSFLGPHHKKLLDAIATNIRAWCDSISLAETARARAAETASYADLSAFMARLNDSEGFRFAANRSIAVMQTELGLTPSPISSIRWVISPRSQDDTERVRSKNYRDFAWWLSDPTPGMFP